MDSFPEQELEAVLSPQLNYTVQCNTPPPHKYTRKARERPRVDDNKWWKKQHQGTACLITVIHDVQSAIMNISNMYDACILNTGFPMVLYSRCHQGHVCVLLLDSSSSLPTRNSTIAIAFIRTFSTVFISLHTHSLRLSRM